MEDKNMLEKTADQMLLVYHELGKVQNATDNLIAALEKFEKKTKNFPLVFLGLEHYRHVSKGIRKQRAEALEVSHVLNRYK